MPRINGWLDETLSYDGSENDVWHDNGYTASAGETRCHGLA
jgi:hypothetical protein